MADNVSSHREVGRREQNSGFPFLSFCEAELDVHVQRSRLVHEGVGKTARRLLPQTDFNFAVLSPVSSKEQPRGSASMLRCWAPL